MPYLSVTQLFLTLGTPNFNSGCEGTPQNFALPKGGAKQHVATKIANPI
jgi:hypothetical protein